MLFTRIVLWLLTLSFLGFGLVYVISPALWTEPAAMLLESSVARTEVRAVYGGFQIGFGLFLLWSVWIRERWRAALLLIVLTLGTIASCRLLGIVAENAGTPFHLFCFAIEAGFSFLACIALRLTRNQI